MSPPPILLLKDIDLGDLNSLLFRYHLTLIISPLGQEIPGSFWGDEEAGLIQDQVYARLDTPVHSVFHESCHFVCMNQQRRSKLDTNAGGTATEENAVCYLQILLAAESSFICKNRMMQDMDSWGYSFRLGSAEAWFNTDAEETRQWLLKHRIVNETNNPTFNLRN